jgi:hypothetical protein
VRARVEIGSGGLAKRQGSDDSGPSLGTTSGHQGEAWRTYAAGLRQPRPKA